ncbi:hypothetical protein Tco_0252872 [Tanacetum coccineum]
MAGLPCNKFRGDNGKIIPFHIACFILQRLVTSRMKTLALTSPSLRFIQVDVPSKLPKVSLVNASLKKLKFYLTQFDSVVKKRTTPSALEEDLLNEITKVQIVFDQMEASVQQFLVDKKCLEIAKKEILLENDRLLQKIMYQDVLITFSKSKQAYNALLKSHSQPEKHCISLEVSNQLNQEIFQKDESCINQNALEIPEYFEKNDLKAQLQDKDMTICKLKEIIKSMREKSKDDNVNNDLCELETKNDELENSVAKLLYDNERLCNEINHVKQVFKDQFDSIKQTRVRHKEQSDSLIDQLNLKSMENEDLKAQIQDKILTLLSLVDVCACLVPNREFLGDMIAQKGFHRFGSVEGNLDPVNPSIREPVELRVNRVLG